jgi:hypothetical protein
MRTALRESHPSAAVAVLPVNVGQDTTGILPAGGITKGVAQRILGSMQAGRTTEGISLCALGPLPSHAVVDTAGTAAALAARPGTAVCTDGCAGVTCTGGHARTFVLATIIAAMSLAIANPYMHSAHGTVADMGGAAGGAVGDVVAPDDATPATAGVAPEGNTPPAGSLVQGAHGHSLPSTFTEAELHKADPRLQRLIAADQRLLGIFGNTIHLNDGTHLDNGIGATEDAKWQRLYNRVATCSLPLYNLPNGRWAHRFLTTLTDLWVGVIQRRWNSERLLVFQVVILCRVRGITQFHDVKPIIWGWLDTWDAARYVALVREVEEANLDSGDGRRRMEVHCQDDATSLARRYDAMVLGGKVRAAVRMVTNRGGEGPYHPHDLDSKSGCPVINVLC